MVFAACGDSGGGDAEVELSEFAVSSSPGSLSAGEINFNTTNAGDFPHELVIARTDLAADALPTDADGGVDESQLDIIGGIQTFEGGATASVAFDLDEGGYVLFCNIVFVPDDGDTISHYANGMTAGFTVSG